METTTPKVRSKHAEGPLVMPGWFLNYLDGIEAIASDDVALGLTDEEYRARIRDLEGRYQAELMRHGLLYSGERTEVSDAQAS